MIVIAFEGGKPIYLQIYEAYKKAIRAGTLRPNERLDSKRMMQDYYNVSRNTIQNALELLIEEGFLRSVERVGYFVNEISALHERPRTVVKETETPPEREWRYDFSYSGVDPVHFPYDVLRKLSKEVYEGYVPDLSFGGDPQGERVLREAIAGYLQTSRGLDVEAKDIIVHAGTEYLFQILFRLFPEDAVFGVENPGFAMVEPLFRGRRTVLDLPVGEEGAEIGTWPVDAADILCITPAHQFPMGTILPIADRVELLNRLADTPGKYLVEDDYDSEFRYKGQPVPAMKSMDRADRVVYMGSFSKALSPAFRISYMILPSELSKRYHEEIRDLSCPVSVPVQHMVGRFISEGHFERHLNRMRSVYRKRREALIEAVRTESRADVPEVHITGADAGLHVLLHLPQGVSATKCAECARLQGVRVESTARYRRGKDGADRTLILGFSHLPEKKVAEAVHELFRVLKTCRTEHESLLLERCTGINTILSFEKPRL